ncbi:hypothetical protein IT570_10575 [Candidatus Sumerlaeota bacterium]|nr:hypothetical protein [Candidatus Sumerlaeota bacterium]
MTGKQKLIATFAIITVLGMALYLWPRVQGAFFGMAPPASAKAEKDSGRLTTFGKGGPSDGGSLFTEKERLAMAKQIGITPDQEKKINAIFAEDPPPKTFQDRLNRLYKAESVLTPVQRLKARAIVPGKIAARFEKRRQNAKKNLPPDEFAAYDKKFQAERTKILKTVPDGIAVPTPVP